MFLITSAAYSSPALVSEFGKLPPAFLPVQNRRLFEHQLKLCDALGGKRYLSIPQSFKLEDADRKKLEELECGVVCVPDHFSLGQSIVYCLSIIADFSEPLYMLHGDTLFRELPTDLDCFSVADPEDEYSWALVSSDIADKLVYSGFFSFSSQIQLIRSITESEFDFMHGLKSYSHHIDVHNRVLPFWMDFGLVNSYYRSVSRLTTERAFNSLSATKYSITKKSKDKRKILAEAHWLKALPTPMKHYGPAVWDVGEEKDTAFYTLEYFYLSSLANLFAFGRNSISTWREILTSCKEFIDEEVKFTPKNKSKYSSSSKSLFINKTRQRLKAYCDEENIDLDKSLVINGSILPSLSEILDDLGKAINVETDQFVSLLHGDFCFSNILYDFKSKSIKVLDPRGIDMEGNETVYGDFRYDVAKLAHSVVGLYDMIIAGRIYCTQLSKYDYTLVFDEVSILTEIQTLFMSMKFGGYTIQELSTYPLMIGLFLSMLPLHSDRPDRQKAMFANALRLYRDYRCLK